MSESKNKINCISFNQDCSCFIYGTDKGFGIFNISPCIEILTKKLNAKIILIEMLYKSNIIAFVGIGKNLNEKKVVIWDDQKSSRISDIDFANPIKKLKFKNSNLFVVTQEKIYLFDMIQNFKNTEIIKTYDNPYGVFGISSNQYVTIIAYPNTSKGNITLKFYDDTNKTPIDISAHQNEIRYIEVNNIGSLCATSSVIGTVIRIYEVETGVFLMELRRGIDKADILSLSFDFSSKFLACTSDQGTVHIFSLNEIYDDEEINGAIKNKTSIFKNVFEFFSINNSIFSSRWSFAQFWLVEEKTICCFQKDNLISVISENGKYYEGKIDPEKGGEVEMVKQISIKI